MDVAKNGGVDTIETNKALDLYSKAVAGAFLDWHKLGMETAFHFYKVIPIMAEEYLKENDEGVLVPNENAGTGADSFRSKLETMAKACTRWKGKIDSTFFENKGEEIEGDFEDFFDLLILALERAESALNRETDDLHMYCKIIKGLLFMNSLGVRSERRYWLPNNHPMVLMQQYTKWLTHEELHHLQKANISKVERDIISQVIDVKNQNRLKFYLYSENKVYEVRAEVQEEVHQAIPFKNVQDNTQIPAIRIWEKVLNTATKLRKNCKKHEEGRMPVHIAVFGELQNEELLHKLCDLNGIDAKISHYRKLRGEEGFMFEYYTPADAVQKHMEENSVRLCDLLYSPDLKELFEYYELVLFLDLNCFYKQRQNTKNIHEKNVLVNCRWYMSRASQFDKFKDKAACYQQIFNAAGEWLNSYNSDMSSKYEFDEHLYFSILNNIRESADVYLYIKHGNKIAGKILQNSNVCSDEYYDGKPLTVYKYISDKEFDNREAYLSFLEAREEHKVRIDIWKIIKSITNSYYEEFIAECFEANGTEACAKAIQKLKSIYCILDYGQLPGGVNRLSYCLNVPTELNQKAHEIIENLIKTVLNYAFEENSIVCVHNYFKHLIVQSIVSNANNVTDILFAHLLSKEEFKDLKISKERDIRLPQGKTCFDVRKTIQSIIENLATLRLRNMVDKEGYFINDFRKEVCPRLDVECFKAVMSRIHDNCSRFEYKNSQLYVNSSLNNNV